MRKGIAPLVVVAIFGALALSTEILVLLIGTTEISVRILVEKEILAAINRMEFLKREIPVAIQYSFYQASYDLTSRGGYTTFSTSYNCIPYWKVFSQNNIPDAEANMQNVFLKIFSRYTTELGDVTTTFPKFQVTFDKDAGNMKVFSSDKIVMQNPDVYLLKEDATFEQRFDTKVFVMFDAAKDFAEKISQEISSSSSYSDAVKRIGDAQTEFNSKYQNQFLFVVSTDNNLGKDENNFAFRTSVIVVDTSDNNYPVYDFSQSKNVYSNLKLNFYIFDGKDNSVQPQINPCEGIKY